MRVLITGANIISALGLNLEENWDGLVAGRSGVTEISRFDVSRLQTRIAAQVPASFEEYAAGRCKKRVAEQMTRVARICYVCALEAVEKARLTSHPDDPSRAAVIVGAVSSGNSSVEEGTVPRNKIVRCMSNAMPAWISMHYGLTGPSFTVNTACASSAYAIALGYEMIRSGAVDMVIAAGADSTVNPEEILGFNELYALATENDPPEKASRPFTKNRDGFVLGEGAGALVLESEESALARGAFVYAELAGCALTSEAYNIMSPKKDGEGMADTMSRALASAGLAPGDVDYVNAHGTSTTLNDLYETLAIKRVLGARAREVPVSSSKSMIGHTIGAAGAIEAAITALSISRGIVTPTINYDMPDPELDLDYVPNISRDLEINVAISNSFAFGGHNAALVLKKYRT